MTDGVEAWLKEDNLFNEMLVFWRNITDKNELEESKTRGLKSEKNEKINEQISLDCNKYNILLRSTLISYIWGSLFYLTRSFDTEYVGNLSLFSAFKRCKLNISRHVMNRILILHRSQLPVDDGNQSI